jgi:hypothetical protein
VGIGGGGEGGEALGARPVEARGDGAGEGDFGGALFVGAAVVAIGVLEMAAPAFATGGDGGSAAAVRLGWGTATGGATRSTAATRSRVLRELETPTPAPRSRTAAAATSASHRPPQPEGAVDARRPSARARSVSEACAGESSVRGAASCVAIGLEGASTSVVPRLARATSSALFIARALA